MGKIMLILALAVLLAGCGRPYDDGILVIGDRFFVNQVHDIFLNTPQYLGRTIRYEGIFRTVNWRAAGYDHVVMRYVAGCCTREPIGFFILLPESFYPFPPDHAWVEITGVLKESDGFLALNAISLVEMEERGFQFVW